jgi:hypothetical protein
MTTKQVGRPRQHANPAVKQAAYRSRLKQSKPTLRAAASQLHAALNVAADSGDKDARSVLGLSPAETLSNLARRYGAASPTS